MKRKKSAAQPYSKYVPLITFVLGLLLVFGGLALHYAGSGIIGFIIFFLALIALGFSTLKGPKILGVISYCLLFILTVFWVYLIGLPYLKGSYLLPINEKLYLFKTIFLTGAFVIFNNYLARLESEKKNLTPVLNLLFSALIALLAFNQASFFSNRYLPLLLLVILIFGSLGMILVKSKIAKVTGVIALLIALLVIILRFVPPSSKIYTLTGPEYTKADEIASKVLDQALAAYNQGQAGAPTMQNTFADFKEKYGNYQSRSEGEAYHAFGLYFIAYKVAMDKSPQAYLVVSFKKSATKTLINTLEFFEGKPDFSGDGSK